MSTRRSVHRRARATVLALVTGGVLAAAAPASAVPTEGEPDLNPGARLRVRAADWPGGGPGDNTRLVSDGYVSFLVRQPECADQPER